jgi:Phage integrase family
MVNQKMRRLKMQNVASRLTIRSAVRSFDYSAWHPGGLYSAFFHYQQGYRAGGLAVAPSGSALESYKYVADDLNMDEIGVRFGREAYDPLLVRAALFAADWNHMQPISWTPPAYPMRPTSAAAGSGLDADVAWRLSPELTLSASGFLNDSKLLAPEPDFATTGKQTPPDVARNGGRLAAQWQQEIARGGLSAESSVRAHTLADLPDPTRTAYVKGAYRQFTRGRPTSQPKQALRWKHISYALSALDTGSSTWDLRAKALLAVAYSTMVRRAELVALTVERFRFDEEGEGIALIHISKGNREEPRFLSREVVSHLQAWLKHAGITSGPVFRRIENTGTAGARALHPQEVARILQRVARAMNTVDPAKPRPDLRLGAHSTRIGVAHDMAPPALT